MTNMTRKPWQAILELAARAHLANKHWTTTCQEQALAREQGLTGKLYLGQRIRVTVDDVLPGHFNAKAGMLGTVAHMPSQRDPDYGVLLDEDPARRRRAYSETELTPAA